MTDNARNTSTEQEKPEPKYRKRLNNEQLEILDILSVFRFASSEQLARFQEKPNAKAIQKRLTILEDQELIAKRYDKSYKLRGKPAAYYLTPKGARTLTKLTTHPANEPINTKSLYRNKDVSENFIEHSRNILSAYLALRAVYGNKLDFFTRSDLSYEHYDYYPQPLPDAHIRIATTKGDRNFFLDIYEDHQPFFVMVRRIKRYLDYAQSGDWNEGALPTVLMVVQRKSVHKRLRKRITYELRESYEELTFATARLDYILDREYKGEAWLPIDEDGDDPDEPVQARTLTGLPLADR